MLRDIKREFLSVHLGGLDEYESLELVLLLHSLYSVLTAHRTSLPPRKIRLLDEYAFAAILHDVY